ncbi:MAG: hypothetical protein QOJ29_2216, partial [Thermoleophilaceae bacterium]|nr:hypothetical protein [Thermoleophilaceae bacterium]
RASEYSQFQHDLGEGLKADSSGGWNYEGVKWRDIGSYDTGGGYTSLVPLVLVRREGPQLAATLADAECECPRADRIWLAQMTHGWNWQLRDISVDVYDFGVGVIKGSYSITAPAGCGVDEIRRTIAALSWLRPVAASGVESPIAASYKSIARDTTEVFSRVVGSCAAHARQEAWLAPLDSHDNWGRLMWLHPVYVLPTTPRAGARRLNRLAQRFAATFSKSIGMAGGVFVPGIDTSVVVVRGRIAGQEEIPLKLTGLMWAYYALFMEMDRGLLSALDDDKWSQSESLPALERDADRIFALHMRVQEARARLDSALTDLGGGELSLWDAIADVVKFRDLVAAVEGKVDALQRIAERRAEQAAATRARRTSSVLSGLTALTIVTVAIALMTNFIGSRADPIGHFGLRVGVVAGAFLVAVLLYREAKREMAREWVGRAPWRRRRPKPRAAPEAPHPATVEPVPGLSGGELPATRYEPSRLRPGAEPVRPASLRS